MDLFCVVYTLFLAETVAEFAKAVVAEQVVIAAPGLAVVDPAGQIAGWIGEKVAGLLPDPCEEAATRQDGRRVDQLAADLLCDAVDRALGIQAEEAP